MKTQIESFSDNLCPLDIQKWNKKIQDIVHWNVANNVLTSYVCLVNDAVEVPESTHWCFYLVYPYSTRHRPQTKTFRS